MPSGRSEREGSVSDGHVTNGHLEAGDLAAYLDGGASAEERAGTEAHLSICSVCCGELIAVQRLRRRPMYRRPVWLAGTAVAAAAVVALLVGQPWSLVQVSSADRAAAVERSSSADRPFVEAVTPAEGAAVPAGELVLVWRPAGSGSPLYAVSVATVDGDSVWGASTRDTVQVLPAGILEPDRTYLWYVDALLTDGRPASTGIRHFRTGR